MRHDTLKPSSIEGFGGIAPASMKAGTGLSTASRLLTSFKNFAAPSAASPSSIGRGIDFGPNVARTMGDTWGDHLRIGLEAMSDAVVHPERGPSIGNGLIN